MYNTRFMLMLILILIFAYGMSDAEESCNSMMKDKMNILSNYSEIQSISNDLQDGYNKVVDSIIFNHSTSQIQKNIDDLLEERENAIKKLAELVTSNESIKAKYSDNFTSFPEDVEKILQNFEEVKSYILEVINCLKAIEILLSKSYDNNWV